jgi:3-methyladenine DNA glycosylase AlkC
MGAMDELIDAAALQRLRNQLQAASDIDFPAVARAASEVDGLKLRQRVDLVAAALIDDLPSVYGDAATIVRAALADPAFAGWTIWPIGEAMTALALGSEIDTDFEDGLAMMADLTPRLSSEFAIRPFLGRDLDRSLAVIGTWPEHDDPHVRRLASEGTRSYLPWAIRVPELLVRRECTVPILDSLYRDDDEVVRRSVANHLNDLSRHAPDVVVSTAARWTAAPDANTAKVVRHALRTLIKRGLPEALALQGFAPAEVAVRNLRVTPDIVELPGEVEFAFDLTNTGAVTTDVAIDYVVHFRKKNGSLAAKVFKLTTRTLDPGETVTLSKRHGLRQMTTRVHHAGEHELELQINGQRHGRAVFDVVV